MSNNSVNTSNGDKINAGGRCNNINMNNNKKGECSERGAYLERLL